MGQYHKIVNLDKREVLHPHKFGDGLKLMEFGSSGQGTMTALAVLLAASCKGGSRGGGDIHSNSALVGSWAGDRIAIVGDYANDGDVAGLTGDELRAAYATDGTEYRDISDAVRKVLIAAGEIDRTPL